MRLAMAKSSIKTVEAIAKLLVKYTQKTENLQYKFYDPQTEINKLKVKYSDIVEAFFTLGYEIMEANEFKMHLIQKMVNKRKLQSARFQKPLVSSIHKEFERELSVSELDATRRLQGLYDKHSLAVKAHAKDLTLYFEAIRTSDKTNSKVYRIDGKRSIN
jgi:hypothetical protein